MIDSRLYPYQVAGAQFLAERASAMLADDMGIGKTAQAIAACDLAGVQTAVVVCPGIARENWKREFASWGQRNRRCYVVRGTPDLLNVRALTADVLIISYALLAQEKARRWLARHRFDALICDEAQALKSPESKRSKAVYGSKFDRSHGLASLCDRVWLLTGTPMPNHPGEMWTHVRALWPESLAGVGLRHDEWLWNFCRLDEMTGAVIGARRVPELLTLLKPHVLQRRQIDVQPELPPLRWSNVTVAPDTVPPLPPELAAATSVLAAALAEAKGDDAAAAIAEAEAMHLATLRRWTGVAKAGAVVDLLKADFDAGLESVVVFGCHVEVLETIARGLGSGGALLFGGTKSHERQQIIDDFQAGRLRWVVCQMSIASTALTLTRASHVVFAESSWVPADMLQAAKRSHRIGQARPVLARVISLAGSIDEAVNSVLVRKSSMLAKIALA